MIFFLVSSSSNFEICYLSHNRVILDPACRQIDRDRGRHDVERDQQAREFVQTVPVQRLLTVDQILQFLLNKKTRRCNFTITTHVGFIKTYHHPGREGM